MHVGKKARATNIGVGGDIVAYSRKVVSDLLKDTLRTDGDAEHQASILPYHVHQSRLYPREWYENNPLLSKFVSIIDSQGWTQFLETTNEIYPLHVVQFWATVEFKDDECFIAHFGLRMLSLIVMNLVFCLGLRMKVLG